MNYTNISFFIIIHFKNLRRMADNNSNLEHKVLTMDEELEKEDAEIEALKNKIKQYKKLISECRNQIGKHETKINVIEQRSRVEKIMSEILSNQKLMYAFNVGCPIVDCLRETKIDENLVFNDGEDFEYIYNVYQPVKDYGDDRKPWLLYDSDDCKECGECLGKLDTCFPFKICHFGKPISRKIIVKKKFKIDLKTPDLPGESWKEEHGYENYIHSHASMQLSVLYHKNAILK